MAAPTNYSDLVTKLTGGSSGTPENVWEWKGNRDSAGAVAGLSQGSIISYWTMPGARGYGAAPGGTARNPTNATDGSVKQVNPSGGRKKWLVASQVSGGVAAVGGMVMLFDRLADISGFPANVSTLQTISGLAVNRYTGTAAIGNQIWIEIYTLIGSSQQTATINYTNELGVPSVTTTLVGGSTVFRQIRSFRPVTLAAGDFGVRSVQSIQLAGTTGAVGDYGVTIARPLAYFALAANGPAGASSDFVSGLAQGPVEVTTDACLFFGAMFTSSTASPFDTRLQFVES